MATQNTVVSIHNNSGSLKENMRKLISLDDKKLDALRYWGDRDDPTMSKSNIRDHNVPSKSETSELQGVSDEADVQLSNVAPTQSTNYVQQIVKQSRVRFSDGKDAIPGQLGNITKQEEKLNLRVMGLLNDQLCGNIARKEPGDGDGAGKGGKAGSPITWVGNGNEDPALNPGIYSVASTLALTNAGGNGVAIDDDTVEGNRGVLEFEDLLEAMSVIYGELDTAVEGGMLRDSTYVAFLPQSAYNSLVMADPKGIPSLNQFNTNVGGAPLEINTKVLYFKTAYGKLMIFPITNHVGDGSNNKFGMVFHGTATGLVYHTRPYTKMLNSLLVDDQVVIRTSYSIDAPHQSQGVAIVGVK